MRVGIYNLQDPNGKDLAVQQAYDKILAHNGIASVRLRIEQPDFWEQVRSLSLFIMRFKQHSSDLQLAHDILPGAQTAFFNKHRYCARAINAPVRVFNRLSTEIGKLLCYTPRLRLLSNSLMYIGVKN